MNGAENISDSFNFKRKVYHLTGLLIPFIYLFDLYDYFGLLMFKDDTRSMAIYTLGSLVLILVVIEILRFNFEACQRLFVRVAGKIIKERELDKPHGSMAFLFANGVVVGFFPKEVAIVSIMFLNFGDPAAAYFGEKFGKTRLYNNKSLEGSLAGAGGAFLAGAIFLALMTLFPSVIPGNSMLLWSGEGLHWQTWFVLLVAAVGASFIELVSGDGFTDDNLTIPIGSCIMMVLLLAFFDGRPLDFYLYNWHDLIFPLR